MIKFKIVSVSFVQDTKENIDCLFTDNEKFSEILLESSNHIIVGINIPVGIKELIKWKGGMLNVLESMGARGINIGTNMHSSNSFIIGKKDKLVCASFSVEYLEINKL